jgi:hypothetical protein
MTSQRQRLLAFGIFIGVVLVSLAWLAMRPAMIAQSGGTSRGLGNEQSVEQGLHDLALRDLKETQDEIARMKAHGIGMQPGSGAKPAL